MSEAEGMAIEMKKRTKMKWRLFLAAAVTVFCIGGCGKDEAQEASAQGEDIVQDVDSAAGAPEDTDASGNSGMAEDTNASGNENTTGDTDAAAHGTGAKEQAQDIEIDEETKEELTTQLLEEKALDTSVVDNMQPSRGCTFTLPEGFTEVEDMPGMYVTKRYPIDASTIYYVEMGKDISLQLMTEDTFLTQMQDNFEQIYGTDVGISLECYEKMEIDGYPAFKILCSYTVDEIKFTQLEYVINADKSYVVTYSQTHEYDRMEEFEASAATIHVEISK